MRGGVCLGLIFKQQNLPADHTKWDSHFLQTLVGPDAKQIDGVGAGVSSHPRMVVKSLIDKTRNRFNISIAEMSEQDIHQTIVLGMTCVASTAALADSLIEAILMLIENNTDAEIVCIQREVR